MVPGVSGQLVVKHVVEAGKREVVQIQNLHMGELIVIKIDMDMEIDKVATLTIAPVRNYMTILYFSAIN